MNYFFNTLKINRAPMPQDVTFEFDHASRDEEIINASKKQSLGNPRAANILKHTSRLCNYNDKSMFPCNASELELNLRFK